MRQWATRGGDIVYGRQVSGGTAMVQRHEHMLQNVPGDLLSDAEWGIGLDAVLGQNDVDTASLASIAQAQHKTDPETLDAAVTISAEGSTLKYDGRFTANDGTTAQLVTVIE
jgi:hypothetical protein